MCRILIVEDNTEINAMMAEKLQKEGMETASAYSGTEAELLLSMQSFDVVLLDLMLPGLSGEETLARLRERAATPVIVVSAKDAPEVRVDLLLAGADDYLVKPFDLNELVARVRVQLRKAPPPKTEEAYPGITTDPESGVISYQGTPLPLIPREACLLGLMLAHPQKVFSKRNLYESCWEEEYFGDENTIHVHVSNLRKKLRSVVQEEVIETVWGMGFKLAEAPKKS